MIYRILAILLGLIVAKYSGAATITLSACTQTEVNNAIASATAGDTIQFPAGTCTVQIITNKALDFRGAANRGTTISGGWINLTSGASTTTGPRIIGFRLPDTDIDADSTFSPFAIVDNEITATGVYRDCIKVKQDGSNGTLTPNLLTGLISGNSFMNCRVFVKGTGLWTFAEDQGARQHYLWSQKLSADNSDTWRQPRCVLIKNNVFDLDIRANAAATDAEQGGCHVDYYNWFRKGMFVTHHGAQGGQRSARGTVLVGNILDNTDNLYDSGGIGALNGGFNTRIRGGTGLAVANRLPGYLVNQGIVLDVQRDVGAAWGSLCDGTNSADENQSGQSGYRCMDGIGAGSDISLRPAGAPVYANIGQNRMPFYIAGNRGGSDNRIFGGVVLSWSINHVRANADYYDDTAGSFNGASGVGVGPLANRPATCTAGVAYVATDQNWSDLTSFTGPSHTQNLSGTLYQCASANTWQVWHTLSDAHPLDAAGGAPANSSPTVSITAPTNGASIVVNTAQTITATAADSDGTIAGVEFRANGVTLGTDTTAPYSFAWTPTGAGAVALTAVATDNSAAATASAAVNVTITAAPTVACPGVLVVGN